MLDIISNGSKWAGQQPDDLQTLIDVLSSNPLDPTFEEYGNFIHPDGGALGTRFFGNFAHLSHVFQIDTDEPELIQRLTAAIRANQATPAYQKLRAGYRPCQKCGHLAMHCRCPKQQAGQP